MDSPGPLSGTAVDLSNLPNDTASKPTPDLAPPSASQPVPGADEIAVVQPQSLDAPAAEPVQIAPEQRHRNALAAGEMEATATPPTSIIRGRGRGSGRPRGRPRAGGGGRGAKRKRSDKDDDDDDDGDSDSSEVYTPVATQTKSGRSIQKPTTFVPPPPVSPTTTTNKRRKTYRRNPESAVCKVCLRGTSPASNMIVFCDGCNSPYHRYCHRPTIDQSVIDEVDKEWFCKPCEKERLVPDSEISSFVSAEEVSEEERRRYFSNLPHNLLVTLITKATTLKPDLPLFSPEFRSNAPLVVAPGQAPLSVNAQPQAKPAGPNVSQALTDRNSIDDADEDDGEYGPDEHPAQYPRPGDGLMKTLPPEKEDLQWLVDDDRRSGVFSHVYQVDPIAANGGLGEITKA